MGNAPSGARGPVAPRPAGRPFLESARLLGAQYHKAMSFVPNVLKVGGQGDPAHCVQTNRDLFLLPISSASHRGPAVSKTACQHHPMRFPAPSTSGFRTPRADKTGQCALESTPPTERSCWPCRPPGRRYRCEERKSWPQLPYRKSESEHSMPIGAYFPIFAGDAA